MMTDTASSADIVTDFLAANPVSPLIVVLGPTASGKTAFSLELARELLERRGIRIEIVNADSRQLYRSLDIGTAKVTPEEMQGIPHHLVSVLDPKQDCSVAWFQKAASMVIRDIHSRGAVPMLVGGSMLYVSALIDGFEPKPSDPALRERLSREYDADGGTALMKRLFEIDPTSANSIPTQNKVYLIRALEIFYLTGKSKSEAMSKKGSSYDLLMFGMQIDFGVLKRRITDRTKAMFDAGWIEEVRSLKEKGYTHTDPALKSHGYPEILGALEHGHIDRESLMTAITRKTVQYAKRSITWWKRDPRIRWVPMN